MHYLAIGHICQDLLPDGWMFGGAATYSARTARALGCQVQVITSLRADVDVRPALNGVEVINYPSEHTTTFENVYTSAGRHQTLHGVAERLTPDRFPATLTADIVHLAPVAQEVDLSWLERFPGALIGVTPQGWLRRWDAQGRISPIEWADAAKVLPHADVVIVSIEDVAHDEALLQHWAAQARLLVVTRGAHGCTIHRNNTVTAVPTHAVEIVDATGAGDIFAASFLVQLRQSGDPLAAARFANCLASQSITRRGLDSIPTPAEIEQCHSV
jgi:sugar/nucleoside kinase (ribokinase family)